MLLSPVKEQLPILIYIQQRVAYKLLSIWLYNLYDVLAHTWPQENILWPE